jgi:hypothetical protein
MLVRVRMAARPSMLLFSVFCCGPGACMPSVTTFSMPTIKGNFKVFDFAHAPAGLLLESQEWDQSIPALSMFSSQSDRRETTVSSSMRNVVEWLASRHDRFSDRGFESGIRQSAIGNRHSAFGIRHSAFGDLVTAVHDLFASSFSSSFYTDASMARLNHGPFGWSPCAPDIAIAGLMLLSSEPVE